MDNQNQMNLGINDICIREREKCQIVLTDMILRKVKSQDMQDKLLEAIENVEQINKEEYFKLVHADQDWKIELLLLRYWLIVNERRSIV